MSNIWSESKTVRNMLKEHQKEVKKTKGNKHYCWQCSLLLRPASKEDRRVSFSPISSGAGLDTYCPTDLISLISSFPSALPGLDPSPPQAPPANLQVLLLIHLPSRSPLPNLQPCEAAAFSETSLPDPGAFVILIEETAQNKSGGFQVFCFIHHQACFWFGWFTVAVMMVRSCSNTLRSPFFPH